MKSLKNQSGFSAIEVVLIIIVLGLIVFLGYTFYNNQMGTDTTNNPLQSTGSDNNDDVPDAPEINSESDLDEAHQTLDQVDVEGSNEEDSSQLESE